ncbi:MAG: hypothetical protein HY735_21215 [Verrucomicrobia bacterium]|nr:hypothetical protein [Verrucomicrobiota bacterium]
MKSERRIRKRPAGPSRGLGDTIAKITHATYLDALVEVYTEVLGRPCRCEERRKLLNRLLPYRRK